MTELLIGLMSGASAVLLAVFQRMKQNDEDWKRITGISSIKVTDDDIVVLKVDDAFYKDIYHMHRHMTYLKSLFPNNEVIIVSNGYELTIQDRKK